MILPVPIYGQRDARWAKQRLGTVNGVTIGSDGCVITSVSMLASYYGHPLLPNQLDDFLTNNHLYYDGDLFVWGSITKLFSDIKFDKVVFCETSPAPITDIKAYLDKGKPVVVALLNYGIKHFILAVGYEGDKIYANDPWQGDQIAINDRWGDPKLKILQVNFYSGIPATNQVTTPAVVPVEPPPVTQPVQPVDAGGDENGINIPTPVVVDQPVIGGPSVNTQPPPVAPSVDLSQIQNMIATGIANIQNHVSQIGSNQANTEQPADTSTETKPSFIDSLKSRKFLLAILSSAVAFINSTFHLGITENQLILFLIPIIAYIVAEGLADAFERGKK